MQQSTFNTLILPIGNQKVTVPKHSIGAIDHAAKQALKIKQFIENKVQEPGSEVIIARYPNRKLYMRAIHSYVGIMDIAKLVCAGYRPKVLFTKTSVDVTEATLQQVLMNLKGFNEVTLRDLIVKAVANGKA